MEKQNIEFEKVEPGFAYFVKVPNASAQEVFDTTNQLEKMFPNNKFIVSNGTLDVIKFEKGKHYIVAMTKLTGEEFKNFGFSLDRYMPDDISYTLVNHEMELKRAVCLPMKNLDIDELDKNYWESKDIEENT